MGSTKAPVVGGICWLCRRLCEGARATPFEAGAATGLVVLLLGARVVMLGSWGCGRASAGRR